MASVKSRRKTALVTGAGIGGIGGSLAKQLHAAGYQVLCAVRRPSSIDALVSQHANMVALELDVTSTESVVAAAAKVSALCDGRLDVLVNNAGTATHRPALDLDVDGVVTDMFDVNVLGVMRMVQRFAGLLIAAKGCVVNIGSVAPIVPMVFSSAYNASKAALHAYGDSLAMEMKPFGVSVVTVITGGVKSNIVRENNPSLPETSLYRPVTKFWLRRVMQSQDGAMDTDAYAASVVRMIQRKNKPHWLWSGGKTTLIWLLYYLLPRWLRMRIMGRSFGLVAGALG